MNAFSLLALDLRDIARAALARKTACGSRRRGGFNLYFFAPFAQDGNLGKAYNSYMELVPNDEDWVCFFDRDVMFLTPDYGSQVHEIISRHPEAGLFTCLTNRIGCPAQLYEGKISEEPDILRHEQIAARLQQTHRYEVERIDAPASGFVMVVSKKTWRRIQFSEQRSMLGVDWQFSKRLAAKGHSIYLMKGLYVFHYYRLGKGALHTSHLQGR